ncbi:MAG: hypothetical protein NT069_03010 [Planctomycetota bacterium]|nr:hypothetical protein [Planctomycetota bacterium]
MLVGAFSSNAYGYPRATKDADLVIEYRSGVLKTIADALGEDFELNPQTTLELMTGTIRNILTYIPTKFEIELFRLGKDPHDQQRFARRRRLPLPDLQIEVVLPTAEDVVIQKLRWQRDKDLADARIVIAVQGERLDLGYIRSWTDQHGNTGLLTCENRESVCTRRFRAWPGWSVCFEPGCLVVAGEMPPTDDRRVHSHIGLRNALLARPVVPGPVVEAG